MGNRVRYHVGIDPAWKNLGVSVAKEDVDTGVLTILGTSVMNPSTFKSIPSFVTALWEYVLGVLVSTGEEPNVCSVTIERFVAYAGVSTAETENICMIIGALQYLFKDTQPLMVRAIDWKTTLVKELYKQKGFQNPSTKLDKKFSDAAAMACFDLKTKLKTDHESDASCLAAFQVITRKKK